MGEVDVEPVWSWVGIIAVCEVEVVGGLIVEVVADSWEVVDEVYFVFLE